MNEAPTPVPDNDQLVDLQSVSPNPFQPRDIFTEAALAELTESIRTSGLLQPLVVRRKGDGFELIAGERRFRACQRAGLARVPVVIRDADDRESLALALIENIQRENLNPLEEARGYRRLAMEFNLRQEEIALRVGKNRSTVANAIRLLQLPAEVQEKIASGAISAGHARTLLTMTNEADQLAAANEIVQKRLSVRDAELSARKPSSAGNAKPMIVDEDLRAAEENVSRSLGTRVHIRRGKTGGGRIEIEFYSLAELNGLIDRLSEQR